MRTSSQFAKVGVPLVVVSVLLAVALILAIALSKKSETEDTKGEFIILQEQTSGGMGSAGQKGVGGRGRTVPLNFGFF